MAKLTELRITSLNKYENDKDVDKLQMIENNLRNIINEKCLEYMSKITFDKINIDKQSVGAIKILFEQLINNQKLTCLKVAHCKGMLNRNDINEIEKILHEVHQKGKIQIKCIVNKANKHNSPIKIFLNGILNEFTTDIESLHVDDRYFLFDSNIYNNDNNNNSTKTEI